MRQQDRRRLGGFRLAAAAASVTLVGGLCAIGGSAAGQASVTHAAYAAGTARTAQRATAASSCHLGNGIKHVVQIGFDNVHFFRDNPNVPSDLQHDAEPAALLRQQRRDAVQQPHAADRPHGR